MSALSAARTLGQVSSWTITNLIVQKTLYIAQTCHLRRFGNPLFVDDFEAWDFGPVVPGLYHSLKKFGRGPINDVFAEPSYDFGTKQFEIIDEAWGIAKFMTPAQLVAYTHSPGGAWDLVYEPSARSRVIPLDLITREVNESARASDEAVRWALEMVDYFETNPPKYLDDKDERAFRARLQNDAQQQPESRH